MLAKLTQMPGFDELPGPKVHLDPRRVEAVWRNAGGQDEGTYVLMQSGYTFTVAETVAEVLKEIDLSRFEP